MLASLFFAALSTVANAQVSSNGQPLKPGTGPGTFEIVGESGVSAQQLFLGNEEKVYIIDKTQNNAAQVNGHPAWTVEYDIASNTYRTMDVVTNTFCAGGNLLADGRWLVVGGNQPVTTGGNATAAYTGPYQDGDGGNSMRLFSPCEDQSCNFTYQNMTSRRWYPTLETLADGSIIIIGGDMYGGYVNDPSQNNPTYEFFPSKGAPVNLTFLFNTMPANLYPLTWLLPSGNLFIQANWGTEFFDVATGVETALPDVPYATRTYPGSAATAMLPLTPANNWTATILFCGGTNLQPSQWMDPATIIVDLPTDTSCVYMTPDVDPTWHDDDSLPVGRSMGNFINLPDGTLFLCNGAEHGTAGYGTQNWTIGESYAKDPVLSPLIYDPSKPAGQRFSDEGLSNSTVARMYHSTATLLPDGSVFVAGSSPHADVVLQTTYPTEYRVERFYPWYYQKTRPVPQGLPTTLSYGGASFDITLTATDLNEDGITALEQTQVVVIRPGYATHAINFGQRHLQLNNTYTLNSDGSATLHVSQMPPNANIFVPGNAYIYVVVNGVPSMGKQVVVGSGQIETQPVLAAAALPAIQVPAGTKVPTTGSNSNSTTGSKKSAAVPQFATAGSWAMAVGATVMAGFALL